MFEEATVKKPKKHFNSEQERDNFVKQYQIKYKTEMCRNWELFGKCKFQDKCSFAHGESELLKKVHLPSNYKTKLCDIVCWRKYGTDTRIILKRGDEQTS